MVGIEAIEKLSRKYAMSAEEFIRLGSILAMKEKKRAFQMERLELLARYAAETIGALEQKIREGIVPEHPAWEDLIEIKNIESEIAEIESDIRTIQAP